MSQRARLLITLAVALLVLSFHIRLKRDPDYAAVNQIADMATRSRDWLGRYPPELDLDTLDGGHFKLSEHVGKEIVILNFFATWCGPCRAEMPELQRFVNAHKGQPVTLVAVDAHEERPLVEKFQTTFKLTMPIVIAPDDMIRRFSVDAFPTTVVIGPDGTVELYESGAIANTDVTLEPLVAAAIPQIAQRRGIGREEFLRRSTEDVRPPIAASGDSGPHLTGRAQLIANSMDCVCGCSDTLLHCKCTTATKMKQKLQKGEFGTKTDAEIKTELNAEFCMKGMS